MTTMLQTAIHTAEEIQRQLIARASDDADFRAQLVADPKETVKQEFGVAVPDFVNISVIESTPNDLHLVLPPDGGDMELDEETLEAVAAGLSCCA